MQPTLLPLGPAATVAAFLLLPLLLVLLLLLLLLCCSVFSVRLSMMEIYCEMLNDLLDSRKLNLDVQVGNWHTGAAHKQRSNQCLAAGSHGCLCAAAKAVWSVVMRGCSLRRAAACAVTLDTLLQQWLYFLIQFFLPARLPACLPALPTHLPMCPCHRSVRVVLARALCWWLRDSLRVRWHQQQRHWHSYSRARRTAR